MKTVLREVVMKECMELMSLSGVHFCLYDLAFVSFGVSSKFLYMYYNNSDMVCITWCVGKVVGYMVGLVLL